MRCGMWLGAPAFLVTMVCQATGESTRIAEDRMLEVIFSSLAQRSFCEEVMAGIMTKEDGARFTQQVVREVRSKPRSLQTPDRPPAAVQKVRLLIAALPES